MKRMVKNGNLLDVKPNGDLGIKGNAQVGGRLQVNSSIISNGEIRGGNISGTKFLLGTEEMPLVKANPAGDATGTLEKIKIGDVAYNVGGGGGSDYTAGSNIEISEAKEISVNHDLTGINTIKFAPSNDYEISKDDNGIQITKNTTSGLTLPSIRLKNSDKTTSLLLNFTYDNSAYQSIVFSTTGFNGSEVYALLTRSTPVPLIPREEGNYLLKATVNNLGVANYTWEKQQ